MQSVYSTAPANLANGYLCNILHWSCSEKPESVSSAQLVKNKPFSSLYSNWPRRKKNEFESTEHCFKKFIFYSILLIAEELVKSIKCQTGYLFCVHQINL